MSSIFGQGEDGLRHDAWAHPFVKVPIALAQNGAVLPLHPAGIGVSSRLLDGMALIPISLVDAQWQRMAGTEAAAALIDAIHAIEDGRLANFSYTPPEGVDGWQIAVKPFEIDGERYAHICHVDDTTSAETPSQLASHAAEGERRRLARELHDGAAQYLIGLHLAIARLRIATADPAVDSIVRELDDLLDQLNRDLRATTYLRHPPEINRLGLHEAIRLLCEGFSERAHIQFSLHFYGSEVTESFDVDTAVYRIAQEALTNVYRHAHARRVHLRLTNRDAAVEIVVQDDGVGLQYAGERPRPAAEGVGVAGMIARVREFGGKLVLRNRRSGGTILGATIPRPRIDWNAIPPSPFVDRRAPPLTIQPV